MQELFDRSGRGRTKLKKDDTLGQITRFEPLDTRLLDLPPYIPSSERILDL